MKAAMTIEELHERLRRIEERYQHLLVAQEKRLDIIENGGLVERVGKAIASHERQEGHRFGAWGYSTYTVDFDKAAKAAIAVVLQDMKIQAKVTEECNFVDWYARENGIDLNG